MILVIQAVQTEKLEDSWRQLALEMIITLAENGNKQDSVAFAGVI